MRLQDKGVMCLDTCPHCENCYKNDWHLFCGCGKARQIWEAVGIWHNISNMVSNATSFVDLIFVVMDKFDNHAMQDFGMMLWCIWRRRNEKLCEEVERQPLTSVQLARETLLQWQAMRKNKVHTNILVLVRHTGCHPTKAK
jgi:hypothetical protein